MPNQLPDWGKDDLTAFLDSVHSNQFATFHNMKDRYVLLQRVDQCFLKIGKNLTNPKNPLAALFLYRSHSAYRAACGTSMAGQAVETFVLLRSCLEYPGYALRIDTKPELGEIWLKRHDSTNSLNKMRQEFRNSNVRIEVNNHSKTLGAIFEKLYERTVHFGGHPNDRALAGSLKIEDSEDATSLIQIYLHPGDLAMEHALKSTAQIGVCALHVFQLIFKARFELLGVRTELEQLRKNL